MNVNEHLFQEYMKAVRHMAAASVLSSDYSNGYQRGLRRLHHGSAFGTEDDHKRWHAATGERGQGYRDGLAGKPPAGYHPQESQPVSHIHIEVPRSLKALCVKAAQKDGVNLEAWLIATLQEKLGV